MSIDGVGPRHAHAIIRHAKALEDAQENARDHDAGEEAVEARTNRARKQRNSKDRTYGDRRRTVCSNWRRERRRAVRNENRHITKPL
jgi:sensor c-di-GMP phosphodiesterase-like protein